MAHLDLQLLRSTGGAFAFDISGRWTERHPVREYKTASHPPELTRVTRSWRVEGALLRASSQSSLLDEWLALSDYLLTRTGTRITGAQIVRQPDGATEDTLGQGSDQEFRVEVVEVGEANDVDPAAAMVSVVPLTLEVSAVRVLPDGNGIVTWDESINVSTESGREIVESVVELSTAEEIDAREAARTYAVLDIEAYGSTYTWHPSSNNDDGGELQVLDPDTPNGRVPTRVRFTSRLQSWRATLGAGGGAPGQKPDRISYSETEAGEGTERRRVYRARATGPGAATWVRARRPKGGLFSYFFTESMTEHSAEAEWTQRETANDQRSLLKVEASGGAQDGDFAPCAVGYPRETIGPWLPVTVTVTIQLVAYGENPGRAAMQFPPLLGTPWKFLPLRSTEDVFPQLETQAPDASGRKWVRGATYVYQAPYVPDVATMNVLLSTQSKTREALIL